MARLRQHQARPAIFTSAPAQIVIEGMAWWKEFSVPFPFAKRTKYTIQQASPNYGTGFAVPAGVSGIAWYIPYTPPKFPPAKNPKLPTLQYSVVSFYDAFQPKGRAFGYIIGGIR
jgi:hypothetical protein